MSRVGSQPKVYWRSQPPARRWIDAYSQEVGVDQLHGRVAVATGAASGVGLGLSARFVAGSMKQQWQTRIDTVMAEAL